MAERYAKWKERNQFSGGSRGGRGGGRGGRDRGGFGDRGGGKSGATAGRLKREMEAA